MKGRTEDREAKAEEHQRRWSDAAVAAVERRDQGTGATCGVERGNYERNQRG